MAESTRGPLPAPTQLTPEQRALYDELCSGPRADARRPNGPVHGSTGDPLAEAIELTRRLNLPDIRRTLADVIPTAKAQRWDPAEVVRVLLAEEAAGRDRAKQRRPRPVPSEAFGFLSRDARAPSPGR